MYNLMEILLDGRNIEEKNWKKSQKYFYSQNRDIDT